jgi:hypothetical protein
MGFANWISHVSQLQFLGASPDIVAPLEYRKVPPKSRHRCQSSWGASAILKWLSNVVQIRRWLLDEPFARGGAQR